MSLEIRVIRESIEHHPLKIIGYACWWTWLLVALNTPTLFIKVGEHYPSLASSFSFSSILAGAVISFVIAIAVKKNPSERNSSTAVVVSAIVLSLATFLVFFGDIFGDSYALAICLIGGVLVGLSLSALQIFWGMIFFARTRDTETGVTVVAGFVLALVLSCLIIDKGVVSVCLTALLPLVSAYFLLRREESSEVSKETLYEPSSKEYRFPLPLNLIVLLVCFAASFGIFRSLFLPASIEASYGSFYLFALICLVPAIIILVLIVGFVRSSNLGVALTIALPLITLGIFVLSLFDSHNLSLELALMNSGVRCVDIIAWIMIANIAKRSSFASIRVFSFGRGVSCIGALIGFSVGSLLSSVTDQTLSVVLFVLLILIGTSAVSAFKGSSNFPVATQSADNDQIPSPLDLTAIADLVAGEYGLSKREKEVFELLGSGRTVSYIAEKLVVANSTISSHVHNIYRKLDIHDRQELLDFIETYSQKEEKTS